MTLRLVRPIHRASVQAQAQAPAPTIRFLSTTTINLGRRLLLLSPKTLVPSPSGHRHHHHCHYQQYRSFHTTSPKMAPVTLPADRRPLIISGPSGVGKGTLFNLLCQRHPDTFTLSVSHTTRAPRSGEEHGVHYCFVSRDEFEDLIAKDGFVEHAQFGGNCYGTSKGTIAEQTGKGKVVVLDIEMEGVKQIKKSGMEARYVFVAPPSEDELEKRLRGRGTEKEESVLKRLNQAKLELEYSKTPGVHDLVIVNDDLDKAYKQLEDFVYKPVDA